MTREEIKRRAELYSALADGKTIQILNMEGNWVDVEVKKLNYIPETLKFRIKPKSQYRPFKSQEECWKEMLNHQPFGWIKDKEDGHYSMVAMVDDAVIRISGNKDWFIDEIMNNYTFADGTPFGIKED